MIMVFEELRDWRSLRFDLTKQGKSVGFVPTMGALHEGHSSLVRKSKSENDFTVVSIFVNPTQFDNADDLKNYPRTLVDDFKRLENDGADAVLIPRYEDLYQDHYRYQVTEKELSQKLCGAHRPGHFDGVLTVVMKLLNIADAQRAYFGEKDYQQYLLVQGMAEAFFMKTEIVGCETVREADGLALSSRNRRLSPVEREKAALFPKILMNSKSTAEARAALVHDGFKVDYVEDMLGRRFGAAHLGVVRLIDNVKL